MMLATGSTHNLKIMSKSMTKTVTLQNVTLYITIKGYVVIYIYVYILYLSFLVIYDIFKEESVFQIVKTVNEVYNLVSFPIAIIWLYYK